MKLWGVLAVTALTCAASFSHANEISVGLNNHVISTELELDLNQNSNAVLGYIYSQDGGSITSGALHMTHDAGVHRIEVGAKFSYIWSDRSPNGGVVGVGGRYAMQLGSNLSLNASGYFAPSVLTFGDIDGQYELDSHLKFQLNPNLGLFVGYRNIRLQYDHINNVTYDSGFYLGGKFAF